MSQDIFIHNLKKFRLAKGLTQEQTAEKLSVNTQTVSRWECGTTLPDVLTLPVLAQLYGVTVDDFYKPSSVAYDNYAQRLAAVYEKTRDPEDFMLCLAEYKKLISAGALSIADKWNMAMLHQFMLSYCIDTAMTWYDSILNDAPESDPYSYNRACSTRIKLFFMIGRGEEIIAELSQAADAAPSNPRALEHLLTAYIFAKRFDEAYTCFKKAIERFPDDWTLYIIGGDICRQLKMYEEALVCYDRAGQLGTDFCDELYGKAFCYEAIGEFEKAYYMYLQISDTLRKRGFDVEAEMADDCAKKLREKAKE